MRKARFPVAVILIVTGMLSGFALAPAAVADWDEGEDYKMHYPQLPDPNGWDVDVVPGNVVADDWQCSESGFVSDIHFWYSWEQDSVGVITQVQAWIYSDIPADESPTGYSMPGEVLWQRTFEPAEFSTRFYGSGNQGFWDAGGGPVPNDHVNYYQCNIESIENPFVQQQGTIYWLALSVAIQDPLGTHIGWKTSQNHWNDDAVRLMEGWEELRDPETNESLDMAFVITGGEGEELDFGDAPDPSYPTLLKNNGARHVLSPFFMGASRDAEPDGQPNAGASGDDNDGNDDEDGVVFNTPLIPGQQANIIVTCSLIGKLDAWVDFNADGDWQDAGEQIFNNLPVNAGPNNLFFQVPASAVTQQTTYARFRFSSMGGLAPTGWFLNGEVEDYPVTPVPEPSTIILMAAGLVGLGGFIVVRRRAALRRSTAAVRE